MVTLLRAPNPSPMTLDGTNGYIVPVGPGELVAIDPGVDDPAHIGAFLEAARVAAASFVAIFVTHGHPDHYPGALALRRATQAPIWAHRSAAYGYDRPLDDDTRVAFADAAFVALHTPGHAPDHLVFWLEGARLLFTGDVVIGTGTVVIAPPSGDMRLYQASLDRLLRDYGHAEAIYGGHGPLVHQPRAKLAEYIEHRKRREAQILTELERGAATIPELVAAIYAAVSATLWPAAARQVLAYLIALEREGRVASTPLERAPTLGEAQLMNPDLRVLATSAERALATVELGFGGQVGRLSRYSLLA